MTMPNAPWSFQGKAGKVIKLATHLHPMLQLRMMPPYMVHKCRDGLSGAIATRSYNNVHFTFINSVHASHVTRIIEWIFMKFDIVVLILVKIVQQ
jgi:hypothetical protein